MPRQDKEVTRSRIEDATIKLFATHSYHSISMDEIASKACISKRTLYKYYPSKAQLFISIFEQNLRQLDAENALLELSGVQGDTRGLSGAYNHDNRQGRGFRENNGP